MFDHLIKYLAQGDSRLRSQLHREKMSTNRSVTEGGRRYELLNSRKVLGAGSTEFSYALVAIAVAVIVAYTGLGSSVRDLVSSRTWFARNG